MRVGFAMTERRVLDAQTGKMINANWHHYKITTAVDFPSPRHVYPSILTILNATRRAAKDSGAVDHPDSWCYCEPCPSCNRRSCTTSIHYSDAMLSLLNEKRRSNDSAA